MDLKYIDIGINLMGKQFASDRDKVVEESLEKGVGTYHNGEPICGRIRMRLPI